MGLEDLVTLSLEVEKKVARAERLAALGLVALGQRPRYIWNHSGALRAVSVGTIIGIDVCGSLYLPTLGAISVELHAPIFGGVSLSLDGWIIGGDHEHLSCCRGRQT